MSRLSNASTRTGGMRALSRRLPAVLLAALAYATAGCASGGGAPEAEPPASASSRLVLAGPLPGGDLPRAGQRLGLALDALGAGNPDAAYGHIIGVLHRCGADALGQQALLLLASAELDPANSDPRLDLAAEAAAQVAARQPAGTWVRRIALALHGTARRLGAAPVRTLRAEEIELHGGSVAMAARPPRPAVDCGSTLGWPHVGVGGSGDLAPPSVSGASYPARLAELRRRVSEMEQELERLRRLTSP